MRSIFIFYCTFEYGYIIHDNISCGLVWLFWCFTSQSTIFQSYLINSLFSRFWTSTKQRISCSSAWHCASDGSRTSNPIDLKSNTLPLSLSCQLSKPRSYASQMKNPSTKPNFCSSLPNPHPLNHITRHKYQIATRNKFCHYTQPKNFECLQAALQQWKKFNTVLRNSS